MKRVLNRARLRLTKAAALLGLVAALIAAAPTTASAASLSTRLGRTLRAPGIAPSATGAFAIHLGTGRVVFARNARKSLRPASNEKLVVALAALDRLGPGFRIPTRVLGEGRRRGPVWVGSLVLKGYGDPTLTSADLVRLAHQLRTSGIRRVTGAVLGDESYFDRRRTAPGWKPSFYKVECPPLSALIINRGVVRGRTVDDPARAAARRFRRALRSAGISVSRAARKGVAGGGATPLGVVRSSGLATIVRLMNRPSDNFYAETLVKLVGAHVRGRGTTAAGTRVVRAELGERGVPLAGVRIVDGSGLSQSDRLTPRSVVALLVSAWSDARVRRAFYGSLPTAGVNGTLRDRMRSGPAHRRVRAKTGTTSLASSLSGYARTRYAFSVLQNGSPIPWLSARSAQDRFAQILAGA